MPIFDWLPHYKRSWLRPDLLAGLSVWALVIPQALGYAEVIGVPPQYGLYTILGASVLYAVFASTRQVVTGPSASVAAVTAPVAALYVASTSPDYLTTVIALTVCVGVVYVLLGVLRMGWVSNFLAKAVLEGFIFAVGFGLIVDQLPKILGIPKAEGSYWDVLVGVVKDLGLTNAATLAVGAAAVGLLLLMRFTAPKLPRAFLVVVLGILAVSWLDLTAHGVEVVGEVPTGLPNLALPTGFSVSEWLSMAVGALAIILVSYSESIATATDTAARHRQEFAPDQELIAQGAAWVGSGLVGGFAGCGSLSKTAVAEGSGQKTQLAGLTVAGLTLLTLLFLAGLFSNLPQAVLGAVVIDAAIGLIHPKVAARFFKTHKADFFAFAGTAIGLFFVGVVTGIVLGILVSLTLLSGARRSRRCVGWPSMPCTRSTSKPTPTRMRRPRTACSSSSSTGRCSSPTRRPSGRIFSTSCRRPTRPRSCSTSRRRRRSTSTARTSSRRFTDSWPTEGCASCWRMRMRPNSTCSDAQGRCTSSARRTSSRP